MPKSNFVDFETKWDCLNIGGEYLTHDSQYNSINHALAALMKIC